MPTEAKRATVAELREDLANSRTLIVSEYRGLKVKEIAEIRRALRKQDVTYRVVKNRLMRIAAEDSVGEALSPLLIGPTAIAFGADEAGTAKAVLDATRPYNKIVRITGARPRRQGDRRRRRDAPGGSALPRCPAGQAGRWDAGTGGHAGRPVRRPAAQPGLCPRAGRGAEVPGRRRLTAHQTIPTIPPTNHQGATPMATATSQDDLLDAIDKMTVLELSEFIKKFEERYGVTAAAPAAVAAAPAAGGGDDRGRRPPPRSRPSSPRPSPRSARTRSRSSRSSASSPVSASRRPRISSTPRPKAVKEGVTRDEAEKIKAAIEEVRAAKSRSSSRSSAVAGAAPGRRCRLRAIAHAILGPMARGSVASSLGGSSSTPPWPGPSERRFAARRPVVDGGCPHFTGTIRTSLDRWRSSGGSKGPITTNWGV